MDYENINKTNLGAVKVDQSESGDSAQITAIASHRHWERVNVDAVPA